MWQNVDQIESSFKPGSIVFVAGSVTEFRGQRQLTLSSIAEGSKGTEIEDLMPSAPLSGEEMFYQLYSFIESDIESEEVKDITLYILKKYEEEIKTHPAAKRNHHNYVGGLAYHTLTMLDLAREISEIYPFLNKDLLYAGVVLHDISKVEEYTGAIGTETTVSGRLIGHISLISNEIALTANKLGIDGEVVVLLKHMVLSHHGKQEWGSPVSPMLPEAELLHHLDMIDSRMDALNSALSDIEKGSFTERIFSLGGKKFYKPLKM